MTQEAKKLTWDDICQNDAMLANLWNKFITEDDALVKECDNYGAEYMKIYRNNLQGLIKAYDNDYERFMKDNMSFWGDGGECDGYNFSDDYFILDISASEEKFATSDSDALELIELIIHRNFGESDKSPTKDRFRKYCLEHQQEAQA
jgi:hypothetical protein